MPDFSFFEELSGKFLDEVCAVSARLRNPFCVVSNKLKPTGEKPNQRGHSVATDKPRGFVKAFSGGCFIETSSSPGTLFYNLCILAFKELEYPANDPRDLIEKVLSWHGKQ